MTKAVSTCVHCGFCLPACPTYLDLEEEMDSPRGRIFLMKEVLEGKVELETALPYVDRCLGCLGCVTACPSGVEYGDLITPFRAFAEENRHRSLYDRFLRWFVLSTLPFPGRFKFGVRMGSLFRPLQRFVPGRLGEMMNLLPEKMSSLPPLPEMIPAEGTRRARVALLAGCAQQILAPEINWSTVRVLAKNGVEVLVPKSQGCCGALAAHTGAVNQARSFARKNLRAFPKDIDAIVTNAAGCGSGIHEYGLWLKGTPEEAEARDFAHRSKDVAKFLAELGPVVKGKLSKPTVVAYHDACHLSNAQKVRSEPRQLLQSIENITLKEVPEGEICCGSAGTYNIEQPEIAARLGRRKAEAIFSTGAQAVATGNIGCMTQIRTHLALLEQPIPVYHTMQLLDQAYHQK
jgi:glycolate oxidase iron-sulfur subunit